MNTNIFFTKRFLNRINPLNPEKHCRNSRLLLLSTFAFYCLAITPILVPFLDSLGLNMTQIMISESIFSLALIILEVPSGWMADRFGRVVVIRMGCFFWMLGLLILWLAGTFMAVVCFQICMGVGMALVSGADLSLLYESVKHQNTTHNATDTPLHRLTTLSVSRKVERAIAARFAYRGWGEVSAALMCLALSAIDINVLLFSQLVVGSFPFVLSLERARNNFNILIRLG